MQKYTKTLSPFFLVVKKVWWHILEGLQDGLYHFGRGENSALPFGIVAPSNGIFFRMFLKVLKPILLAS